MIRQKIKVNKIWDEKNDFKEILRNDKLNNYEINRKKLIFKIILLRMLRKTEFFKKFVLRGFEFETLNWNFEWEGPNVQCTLCMF